MAEQASLWQHRDFLKLWAGQTVSEFGAQITLVAFPLVAVLVLKANAWQMGLFAGVYMDRLKRHLRLIGADATRAILMVLVPILYLFHHFASSTSMSMNSPAT